MFEINATLPLFLLMFWLFTIALDKLVLKPVGAVIAKREGRIKEDAEAGSVARANAASVVSDYESRMHKVRHEAQEAINSAVNQSQEARQAQLTKLQNEAQVKLKLERSSLAGERIMLIDQLVEEEKSLVDIITKKLIGDDARTNLDSATVRSALEEASA